MILARLSLLALAAYFAAATVNGIIALRLAPPASIPSAENPEPQREAAIPPLSHYAVIYTRDLFHSTPSPHRPESARPGAELPLTLWGTAMEEQQGGGAFAIIEDATTHLQRLYRQGSKISENMALARVEWDRVVIRRGEEDVVLLIPTEKRPVPPERKSPLPPLSRPEADGGIRAAGENAFLVDRREVENAMDHLNELFTQIRAVPYVEEGQNQGFRVFAIRSRSVFDRMGLKNGDIIQRINGVELTDPTVALGLLRDLRGSQHITVDLVRNQNPATLTYEIR